MNRTVYAPSKWFLLVVGVGLGMAVGVIGWAIVGILIVKGWL